MRRCLILFLLIAMPCWSQTDKTGKAETSGFCSPAVTGSKNTFTFNCGIGQRQGQKMLAILNKILASQLDPDVVMVKVDQIVANQAEMKELIKGLGESVNTQKLLATYPLGYVIFDVTYANEVFPYQRQGLKKYEFNWSVVRITKNTPDWIELRLPDMRLKDGTAAVTNVVTGGRKAVGYLGGASVGNGSGGIIEWGEILAIRETSVVFLVGFSPAPPLPPPAKPH